MASKIIDIPFDGKPGQTLPRLRRESQARDVRFMLLDPGDVEVYIKTEKTLIDINLNPIRNEVSWNSDKTTPYRVPADSLPFLPQGGEWRIRSQNFLPGFVIEFENAHWQSLTEIDFPELAGPGEYSHYYSAPVAADLGRAGIRLLQEERCTDEPTDTVALEAIALGVLAEHARRVREGAGKVDRTRRGAIEPRRLTRVFDYIEAELQDNVSLLTLARIAGLSASQFGRAFKVATGVTPMRYVSIRRVTRAKLLLQDPAWPLAQIAYACGFSCQSHFTRVFKSLTGATPGAYRRDST